MRFGNSQNTHNLNLALHNEVFKFWLPNRFMIFFKSISLLYNMQTSLNDNGRIFYLFSKCSNYFGLNNEVGYMILFRTFFVIRRRQVGTPKDSVSGDHKRVILLSIRFVIKLLAGTKYEYFVIIPSLDSVRGECICWRCLFYWNFLERGIQLT